MAFKYRLQIFFVILTILPLLAAGWAISGISGKNRTNQTDQQLAVSLSAAEVTYAQDHAAAQATATQLETAMRAQAAPLMQQSRQQRAELRTLLQSADPDAAQVGEKVLAAHATRAQIKALHDDFDAKLKGILTADQQAKLGQLQQRRQRFQVNRPAPQDPGQ